MSYLNTRFGHRLRILHWCVDQVMTNALEEMELTAAQGRIMAFLCHAKDQPPCPRDIEEAFHLSHPTVSGLLSRLEQKGFLELRPDAHDRRCKRIHVLAKGTECHDTMHQLIQSSEARIVQGFTEEEKILFDTFLQRAIANMGTGPSTSHTKEEYRK